MKFIKIVNVCKMGAFERQTCSLFLMLLFYSTIHDVSSYPQGAPEEACDDMIPQHTTSRPSVMPPPFTIEVTPKRFITGEPVQVKINMTAGQKFKGFMIFPRRTNDVRPTDNFGIGSFHKIAGTQQVCENGLTHTDGSPGSDEEKSDLTLQWYPPSSAQAPASVEFRVTLVVDRQTFWADERSEVIYHHAMNPTTTVPPPTPRPHSDDLTEGCGTTKGCYRNPPSCSESACDMLVTWKSLSGRAYEFELSADTEGWVALGLSDDKIMGDDDVMECSWNKTKEQVDVRLSQNDCHQNEPVALAVTRMELSDVEWSRPSGRVRCQFIRRATTRSSALRKTSTYYLLVAKGALTDQGTKKRHSLEPGKYPYVSPSMVDLKRKDDFSYTARYPLVKAHGCLMLIAWMMCASTAILLSKYYKRMWPNDRLCGTEVWFAVHRALMIACLILTAIAFILIFVHVGGYSHMPDYPDKAHPPLGICVMILVILNPFITLFRCKPTSKYRPIFNWFHWLFGTVAYVLQLPAIFIGLNLHKAFVPSWATWVMTAFILFHLIIELLLEIHGCLNARKQKRRDDEFGSKVDFKGDYAGFKAEPVGHRFKKIILTIYLIVVIVLGIVMVIAVAVG